ncbi:hypothetical protein ACWN8P_09640 [Vagococcus salmoninarum]|uniref:Uncharacterized protein n=1 Tax=Vagococcus salmoninarum TaxID=2739 RepID=A0A429ZKF9_9ENTE|nr:hypothetical protein [Vagococcus salmoninarum]RST94153.1 hypothetical protein CBF35_10585 [Vagococcus salmoninarum]
MTKSAWIQKELSQGMTSSRDYKQKALIFATKKIILEQDIRLEQKQGEIDGTLWSPNNWRK